MLLDCPHCSTRKSRSPKAVRSGFFRRRVDGRRIRRFKCSSCQKSFSLSTPHPCYRQKKRFLNEQIRILLCSGVSQRRIALILGISRTTVVRKFLFLGAAAQKKIPVLNKARSKSEILEFDDLETSEHTKMKPLSVTLAVESKTRFIRGFRVSQMPAKGLLAALSRKKYGKRADHRPRGRKELFEEINEFVHPNALIKSDENPHYPSDVKKHFPHAKHIAYKGKRGSVVGQGELKKIRFDPLFSLNHTCAMLRANLNRLFRRTWCTTKKPERLALHIAMYVVFHNETLLNK